MRRREFLAYGAGGATAALFPSWAIAQSASSDTLTIGLGGAVQSLDPHMLVGIPSNTVTMHMFDRLVDRQPFGQLKPGLALSWRSVSPTQWEFKLRPGVKWHDGSDFTSDDVVATIERIRNMPKGAGGYSGFLRPITKVETPDALTLVVDTDVPSPTIPRDLSNVNITSRKYGIGSTTEDYNSGKAAIGTGPYKYGSYVPGDRVSFTRNDAWWGTKPDWKEVTIKIITNAPSRTVAILSKDVDIIESPSENDLPRLEGSPDVEIKTAPGIQVYYLYTDYSREGETPFVFDKNGKPLPKNPLRDVRVRKALSIAINRQAIADRIMLKKAKPTGQWLLPGSYSYAPSVEVPKYDREAAKKMLAEAGYPEGFQITIHTPSDRYLNDARICQAIAQMWTQAGVKTSVEALPWNVYASKSQAQEFAVGFVGWTSVSFDAAYMATSNIATNNKERGTGLYNRGRYSNPELDDLLTKAAVEIDPDKREQILIKVVEIASADVGVIPLVMPDSVWAVRKGIDFNARSDQRTLAVEASKA